MKVLSIRQPWAWLVVHADEYLDPKRIENRSRRTSVRGDVLIHAGKTFDQDGYESVIARRPDLADIMPAPDDFERGGIVGMVRIVDCVDQSDSFWFVGDYGYVMERPISLPFTPMRGMLGFFNAPADFKVPA